MERLDHLKECSSVQCAQQQHHLVGKPPRLNREGWRLRAALFSRKGLCRCELYKR